MLRFVRLIALVVLLGTPSMSLAQNTRSSAPTPARAGLVSRTLSRVGRWFAPRPSAQTVRFRFRESRSGEERVTLGRLSSTKRVAVARGDNRASVSRRVSRVVRVSQGGTGRPNFVTFRGMPEYERELPGLESILEGIERTRGSQGHWVDMGAGDGNATREYLEGARRRVRVTAITFRVGDAGKMRQWQGAARRSSPRSRLLVGSYAHEYTPSEIGTADLVTDLYGAASYHQHIDEVIHQAGTIVREGGHILIRTRLPPELARRWLGRARGIEAVAIEPDGMMNGEGVFLHLRRTRGALRIPSLELHDFDDATAPPARTYTMGTGFVGDAH